MRVVSTSNYIMDLGSGAELVKRGQEITLPASAQQSAGERTDVMLRQKIVVRPDEWPAYRDKTEASWQAAQKNVAQARRESEAAVEQRRREAEERKRAKEGAA